MSASPIDVVNPSFNPEEQRAKISDIVSEFLPELLKRLVDAGVNPIIISIAMASESGVYANAITNRLLCDQGTANAIVENMANLVKEKIMSLETVTCYREPDSGAPRS
jgi:hypothetical protein